MTMDIRQIMKALIYLSGSWACCRAPNNRSQKRESHP